MKSRSHSLVREPLSRLFAGGFLLLALTLSTLAAQEQPISAQPTNGGLDTAFAASLTDGESNSWTSEILPDGKILVGGTYTLVNGVERAFFARLNADGSLDATFNMGGIGPNGQVNEIIRLSDGKFLIGGFFTTYNGTAKSGLARLNADGTLDMTFNSAGTGVTGGVQGITLQLDGKILISSNFSAYNGTSRFGIARVNADGTLDTTFTSPFTATAFVEETAVLSDGRILIGGAFLLSGRGNVMRLNSNGSADTTFNVGGAGATGGGIFAMAVQTDGRILIGGVMSSYNGVPRFGGARLNADGTLDLTFTPPTFAVGVAEWVEVLSDGKILIAGAFFDGLNAYPIIRLNTNGSIDNTFIAPTTDNLGYHFARYADGKIQLTGWFNTINGQARRNAVRLNADGTVDNSFNTALTTFGQVFDVALQPDGKVVASGNFRLANGVQRVRLARFNADGTLDSTFNPGASTFPDAASFQNFINTIAIQADGKILIGGAFSLYNGTMRRGVARLNSNGSLDPTFDAGLDDTDDFPSVSFQHILVQPDGKLMVGGFVNLFSGTGFAFQLIARLNSDGTLDSTFLNGNSTTGGTVQRIIRQSDGKYIVVGSFNNIAGQNRSRIARLNPDSSHDLAFNPGTGANTTIFNAALQADGKILIGGAFVTYNGIGRNRIARVNADGSLDAAFNVGTGANSNVLTFAQQTDGKILIGGFFSTYNNIAANRLARLNADGSMDSSFVSGFANDATAAAVRRMLLQPDNKLLVSGNFRAYSGVTRNSLARLATTAGPARTRFDFDGDGRADVAVFRPSNATWYLGQSTAGFSAIPFGLASDRIVPADYDGDGKTDIGVFRNGTWYWLNSGSSNSFSSAQFGTTGDIPVPADFTGDGRSELAVYRGGIWYTLNLTNNQFQAVQFGIASDKPVVGDYDGDGRADFAVYRDGTWYMQRSTAGFGVVSFGIATDKAVPADYDGDGTIDQAVFRDGVWYIQRSRDGFIAIQFGIAGDLPSPADYDGDGKADVAVFRNGIWYRLRSQAGFDAVPFGTTGDRPIPNAFVP